MESIRLSSSELLIRSLLLFSALLTLFTMLNYVTFIVKGMLLVGVDYLFQFWVPIFDLIRFYNCSSSPVYRLSSNMLVDDFDFWLIML